MPEDIIDFWFREIDPKLWWACSPEFDAQLRARFSDLLQSAARGELFAWRQQPAGRLAEILVLDQFSRNIHRNTAAAFAQDPMALALAQEAVAAGVHRVLPATQVAFLLLPYMHSESKLIHGVAEALYREFSAPGNYEFELRHKAIIDRFGRYPHRNAMLGRTSSPEETAFLGEPGSSF